MTQTLVEVRCPNVITKNKAGTPKQETCNKLCVKVEPGSKGEAHCPNSKCGFRFEFDVAKDNSSIYGILQFIEKP